MAAWTRKKYYLFSYISSLKGLWKKKDKKKEWYTDKDRRVIYILYVFRKVIMNISRSFSNAHNMCCNLPFLYNSSVYILGLWQNFTCDVHGLLGRRLSISSFLLQITRVLIGVYNKNIYSRIPLVYPLKMRIDAFRIIYTVESDRWICSWASVGII